MLKKTAQDPFFIICQMPLRAWLATIVALSSLLLSCPALAEESPGSRNGTVAICFDGDTLKLTDRRIIRLAGIDSPETAHKKHGAKQNQFYALQARNLLNKLARGKKIWLVYPGGEVQDRHGRLIADVRLQDGGSSLSDLMVSQGAAYVYAHRDLNPDLVDRLLELQKKAISERKGLWDTLLDLPIANKTYIGNRNSMRFFAADNPDIQKIKPRNRVSFGTLMDAFLAGYAPARPCPFWPMD